jgi:hypothetical protein
VGREQFEGLIWIRACMRTAIRGPRPQPPVLEPPSHKAKCRLPPSRCHSTHRHRGPAMLGIHRRPQASRSSQPHTVKCPHASTSASRSSRPQALAVEHPGAPVSASIQGQSRSTSSSLAVIHKQSTSGGNPQYESRRAKMQQHTLWTESCRRRASQDLPRSHPGQVIH